MVSPYVRQAIPYSQRWCGHKRKPTLVREREYRVEINSAERGMPTKNGVSAWALLHLHFGLHWQYYYLTCKSNFFSCFMSFSTVLQRCQNKFKETGVSIILCDTLWTVNANKSKGMSNLVQVGVRVWEDLACSIQPKTTCTGRRLLQAQTM